MWLSLRGQAMSKNQATTPSADNVNKTAQDAGKDKTAVSHPKNKPDVKPAEVKEEKAEQKSPPPLKLSALFAFKEGMTNIYDEKNKRIPVTVLRYKPLKVSQIKTKEKDGYSALQVALESPKKAQKPLLSHLKKAGFKKGCVFSREVRQAPPKEGVSLGQLVSIESLKKGDRVSVSGVSKGHGYSGVVKRWGFGGGPASHGAEKHRTTGSIANTATQGRVFPGKKMPGQFGRDKITVKNVQVADVLPKEGVIFIKGPSPGSLRSLIELKKH